MSMSMVNHRTLRQLLKIAVSAALLFVLLVQTDQHQLITVVSATPWWLIPSMLALSFVSLAVSAKRWQVLHGNSSFSELFATSIVSQLYVFIVPTVLSGDAARVVKSTSDQTSGYRALIVVILDRLVGLISLLMVGAISLVLTTNQYANTLIWSGVVLLLLCFLALPLFTKINLRQLDRVKERFLNGSTIQPSKPRLLMANLLLSVREHPFTMAQIYNSLLWGLVFQGVVLFNLMLVGYANHFPLSAVDYAIVSFAIQGASFVPIGIAGIGIKDLTQVSILGLYGIASGPALASSLVSLPVIVVIAAIGWVLEMRK